MDKLKLLSLVLLVFVILTASSFAQDQSETLNCSAESTPANWIPVGGTGCTVLSDASDATWFGDGGNGTEHRFAVGNTAFAWTTIDSVNVIYRWGGKNTKAIPFAVDLISGAEVTGTLFDKANVGPFDSTSTYATKPGGGAWADSDVDAIEVELRAGTIGGGGDLRVMEFSVVVWGTYPLGDDKFTRRRREQQ